MKNKIIFIVFAILFLPLTAIMAGGGNLELANLESAGGQPSPEIEELEKKKIISEKQPDFIVAAFTKTLHIGSTGDQVKQLQEFLKQFPDIYPEGLVTGYFGVLTENAVKRFQIEGGLEVLGVVGPITRDKLNKFILSNNVGMTGEAGATGLTGATGSTGATGFTGDVGATGSTGATGLSGATGLTGDVGATGERGRHGSSGATGATGDAGAVGDVGATGATGSIGATGSTGATGLTGDVGATGSIGATGSTGLTGDVGATGSIGFTGVAGEAGSIGATGAIGDIGATGSTGEAGSVGATGPIGATGPSGAAGATGAAGASGVVSSALYAQLGAQPGSVAAGQAFTYTETIIGTPGIIAITTAPPGGTIFTLVNIGTYEVNYQMTYPADGGIILYLGATIPEMLPLPYTMIGKTNDGMVRGSIIVQTTTANSFLSVNAAAGNSVAIVIPGNSSTANQSATTVSFKRLE